MISEKEAAFVGLDLETTGLDAESGVILEVGLVLFDAGLRPIMGRSWLVDEWTLLDHYDLPPMSAEVAAMHGESGLSADLKMRIGEPLEQVENHAVTYLLEQGAAGLPMLGSSVTFDRRWLARHAPRLLDTFHYRSLDATSVRMAAVAHLGASYGFEAEQWIEKWVAPVSDRMLTDLDVPEPLRRPHRPIYDLCSSAALALVSMDAVAGRAITKTLEDLYPAGETP